MCYEFATLSLYMNSPWDKANMIYWTQINKLEGLNLNYSNRRPVTMNWLHCCPSTTLRLGQAPWKPNLEQQEGRVLGLQNLHVCQVIQHGFVSNLVPSDLVLNTGIATERSFILLQKNYRMNMDFSENCKKILYKCAIYLKKC